MCGTGISRRSRHVERCWRAVIFVAALSQIASSAISLGAAADPGDVIADFSDVRQRIDGFGGSDKRNPLFTDTDADLFFSQSQGIGLSILRVSIDTNGSYTNGSYANATKAAARGAIVWGAPWTPPAAWKDNGNVNNGGHLLPAYYDAWASRLANFASLLQQNAGVPLYGLSVQNEPDYLASYNSALYTSQQMVDFIKVLGPKLAALTPRPRLITPDSAYWTGLWDYSAAIMADPVAASNTDILAVHQYFAPAPMPHAIPPGKPLWQTEMSSFESFSTDIGNGITVAKWIHNALVDASVSAWHYWWLMGLNGDNEGLVNAGGETSKRLYTLGNFSKFIRPGFVRVGTSGGPSGVYVSAYKDPASNTVAIVAINDTASSVPFGLTMNGITAASVTPWVTSATEDLVARAPITVSTGRFTMTLSPSSVTTFVSGNPAPPSVAGLSPASGGTGTLVTITGTNFGSTQGTSTVRFNGAAATPTSWSNSSIVAPVPNDATIGPVVVTVNGVASNGAPFTATTAAASSYVFDSFSGANGTSLASHLPNIGGAWIDDLAGNKIFGNRLEATSFGSGRNHNTTRPATADYEVSVDVTMNLTGSGSKAGVEGRVQTDLRAHGVTIRDGADELEFHPVAASDVLQELRRLLVVAQQQVHLAVVVVVEDRQSSPVLLPCDAVDEGDVGERAVAVVAEQDLALAPVEAVGPEAHQRPGRLIEASTDAFKHVHSYVVRDFPGDEAVLREDVR